MGERSVTHQHTVMGGAALTHPTLAESSRSMQLRHVIIGVVGLFSGSAVAAPTLATLYQFGSQGGSDAATPESTLLRIGGTLFGLSEGGGTANQGALFEFDLTRLAETVVYSFTGEADGRSPGGNMISLNGSLYGVTAFGGTFNKACSTGCGTLFRVDPTTGKKTTLHKFRGADGQVPEGLAVERDQVYGITEGGGAFGYGTVFAYDAGAGRLRVLYSFRGGADGEESENSPIVQHGVVYGTTPLGGASNYGVVFAVDASTGSETVLHTFTGPPDGEYPASRPDIHGGQLYATTLNGGTGGMGSVFSIDLATNAEQVLFSFTKPMKKNGEGDSGVGDVNDHNGYLYGITTFGGGYGAGSIFNVAVGSRTKRTLFSFQKDQAAGYNPIGGLIYYAGSFYGTAASGGLCNEGTIFKLKP